MPDLATLDDTELATLHRGRRSARTRALAAATNRRLEGRGLDELKIPEQELLTQDMLESIRKAAWVLGAQKSTYDAITRDGTVSVGVQRMIRNPGCRSDEQKRRGLICMARLRKQRRERAEAAAREHREHGSSSRSKTVNAFLAKVGTREHPAGSNGGGIITVMESFWGFGRVPWCGISAGYHAKKIGGVNGLRSDVASVAAIENHARAGHQPYGRWQSSVKGALPGSFVVIGGRGVHVGMLVQAHGDGSATTVEGNTSFGPGGSQSNGGCIARRHRSDAEIFGVATMNYPG